MSNLRAASTNESRPYVEWRLRDGYDEWLFGGRRRYDDGAGSIVVSHADLAHSALVDIRRAMMRSDKHDFLPEQILVAITELEEFNEDDVLVEPVSFELLGDGRLAARVHINVPPDVEPSEAKLAVIKAVRPLLERRRATLIEEKPPFYLEDTLLISVPTRGRSMLDLFDLGVGVRLLSEAVLSRQPSRNTLRDLVLAGRADLLVGQAESDWFDAKADHYIYERGIEGKIKLARAVSQFCNGEQGGVIVVGMKTAKKPGQVGDHVAKLTPVPITGATARQYRDALEKHMFPFPEGLQVETVPEANHDDLGFVLISLPPQPEEMKPYIVHGAIIDGKVEGSYFTIVRRSGEDGLPIHASQVHTMLVTGRALLRHGLVNAADTT